MYSPIFRLRKSRFPFSVSYCRFRLSRLACVAGLLVSLFGGVAFGQVPLQIYTDHLVNAFQDWGWGTRNVTNTSPVHSGSNSFGHSGGAWNALSFEHPDFDATPYSNFSFWGNGGASAGQIIQVFAQIGTNNNAAGGTPTFTLTSTWQQFVIPLSTLGIANATNVTRLTIQLTGNATTTAFYVDDIQLTAKPAPALLHVGVDTSKPVRAADGRWFGVNTATWDGQLGNAQTIPLLREAGILAVRWPGGSTSDGYHWVSDLAGNGRFMNVATNIGAQVFITVNYGSGTTNEAAGWVRFANVTNHCGFKYWEIGNENYGTWENDTNVPAHDPFTYANLARDYIGAMKAADPTIKVGVVLVPGEDAFVNNMNNAAVNPRTGVTHYGWTPVLLSTLKSAGVTPDFVVYHFYPQYTSTTPADWQPNSPDSDPLLLRVAVNWAHDAADIRQQITDYLGAPGANIELVCTENNSDAGSMGRQSTSIVNALYLADSMGQLMKTEFNSYVWWDLRNGTDTTGDFDPTLYGWRTYGDYGLINGASTRHPTFYAEKLLQSFVRPGDTVLNASSDSSWLAAYSARKASGALGLLVINKTPTNTFTAQIGLTNFVPNTVATVRTFGLFQDEATRTNGPAASRDIATNSLNGAAAVFTTSFPPYSLTLLTFAPAAPTLAALPVSSQPAGKFVFQLQGQSGARYVIQNSTNLTSWIRVGTNILTGATLDVTNNLSSASQPQFWRALWEPP